MKARVQLKQNTKVDPRSRNDTGSELTLSAQAAAEYTPNDSSEDDDPDPPPPYESPDTEPPEYIGGFYEGAKILKPLKFTKRIVDFKDGEKIGVTVIPKGQPIHPGYTPPPLQAMSQVHLPTRTA